MRRIVWAWILVGASCGVSAAKPCGDDVAGRDVPCACGDLVVSDLRPGDADPATLAAARALRVVRPR